VTQVAAQGQGLTPGAWGTRTGSIAVSQLLQPTFDLGPARRVLLRVWSRVLDGPILSPPSSSGNI
jgi:hypothetical protein